MSLRNQIARRRLRRRGPVPTLIAIMTASGVTLIGLIMGLDPFTIFCRAGISAIVLGVIVSFGLCVIDLANKSVN